MRQSNQRIVRTLFVAALLFSVVGARAANWLFRNGKSNYQIVVAADASPSERTAALELQDYLLQIGGVQLPITSEPDRRLRHIFVGYSPQVAALTGESRPMADDERFTYRSVGCDLLIWGGSQRGTMYGVFTFLERELGVHWLTPDCTVVPQSRQWRLPKLDHNEQPAIGYRYNNYRCTQNQPVWSAHVKENMQGPVTNEYGNQEGYWRCHTMGQLVPLREFYATHPEYFSLRDGKRLSRNEQLYVAPSPLKGRRTSTPLWWAATAAALVVGFFVGKGLPSGPTPTLPVREGAECLDGSNLSSSKVIAPSLIGRAGGESSGGESAIIREVIHDTIYETRIVRVPVPSQQIQTAQAEPAPSPGCSMLCDDIRYDLLAGS